MTNFLGLHITNNAIYSSNNEIIRENFVDYLLYEHTDSIKCLYDLDGNIASLISLLKLDRYQCEKLLEKQRVSLPYGIRLKYSPSHYFSITYGGGASAPFTDLLNMSQVGYLTPSYKEHETDEDCINKAKEARDTAIDVSKSFQSLGMRGDFINSPLSAFLDKFDLKYFPTVSDCPQEASELAYSAIRGQFFESYSLGMLQKAYDYDLNLSYCHELSLLPNIKQGTFIHGTEIPNNATLGIANGILETNAPFHPFITKIVKNNDSIFNTPVGKFPNEMSLDAIKFLYNRKLGSYKITEGHWFIPNPNNKSPYSGIMTWLYNKKKQATGRTRQLCTRIYASLWGSHLQVLADGSFGNFYNPLIANTVETNSRLRVAGACLDNNIIPYAVMADGFVTDKDDIKLPISDKMGEWKLSAQGKCIIAGSGAVTFEGKEPPEGLALKYDALIEQINENPKATSYTRYKYSPVTLALALKNDGKDFDKLGTIQKTERTLTIGQETKRNYWSLPKTGEDLISGKIYGSYPIDYSILIKD